MQMLCQSLGAVPHGIVAQCLSAPFVVARNTAVVEHAGVAYVHLGNVRPLGLETSACTAIYHYVRVQLLYCRQGGNGCRLASHQVAIMLATVQHHIQCGCLAVCPLDGCLIQFAGQWSEEILHLLNPVMLYERLRLCLHGYDVEYVHVCSVKRCVLIFLAKL